MKNTAFWILIVGEMNQENKEHNSEEFEKLKLKKQIAELEKQLQSAEMKAIAFSNLGFK